MRTRLALGMAILIVVSLAACDSGTPSPSPSPPVSGSPSPTATRDGWQVARWQEAQEVTQSDQPLELPYRQLELEGSWHLDDYTDSTVCLRRVDGDQESVWLLPARSGKPKRVLPQALAAHDGFWISGVRLSDDWLAWEELGSGDDLAEDVPWRLYAAPIRGGLEVGLPRPIARASTGGARRPLFDLDGSRLVWTSATPTGRNSYDARLMQRDLDSGRTRVLYRSDGMLHTVTLKDGVAVVMETPKLPRPLARFAVLDLTSGERVAAIDVDNEHPLSHWPAWRDGWLAWAPFADPEAQFPELYLRAPDGAVWLVGGRSHDACFVGPYLFYTDNRNEPPPFTWRVDIRAVRLEDMTSYSLVTGKPDLGDWWHGGGNGAPDVEHTFVAYDDRRYSEGDEEKNDTLVRIFRVD